VTVRRTGAAVRGAIYVAAMSADAPAARRSTTVFDDVADAYDRRRPTYPDELVAKGCELAGVAWGDEVLEVGCGSGQLTRGLLARGLHVVAVEPGRRLLSLAERNLAGCGRVEFVDVPFEEAQLPLERFQAVFSASAFHWLDPEVSWQRAVDVLVPGGSLALFQYFGLSDERSEADREAILGALGRVAPEIAAEWPSYRDLSATIAGVEQRRGNISEAWGWLGSYDLTQARASELFTNVQMAAVLVFLERGGEELNSLLQTLSFYGRLAPAQRQALDGETVELCERVGRPIRSSTLAVVLTARRSAVATRLTDRAERARPRQPAANARAAPDQCERELSG
jgi:SAM-dependent methyltransferase